MLVNFYEDNSQNLNRYSAPSYLTGMGSSPIQAVTEGYLTMIPDVHYHTGASHSDRRSTRVEAAVKKVTEMGYVDPEAHRHQWPQLRREGAAFIATRSRLFAAVGAWAPGVIDQDNDFNRRTGAGRTQVRKAAAARTATTTTSTARAVRRSHRGTTPTCITSSPRSHTCRR